RDRLTSLLRADELREPLLLPRLGFALEAALADDRDREPRPLGERVGDLVERFTLRVAERRGPGSELDVRALAAAAAAECRREQRERRAHRLDEQVRDRLPDDAADRELRIVDR